MAVHFHNTMTGKKTPFTPIDPKRVTMYVCGPTVHNHAHIGNFRAAVAFDQVFRLLRHHYGEAHVVYARNITDIDDKIIKAMHETGLSLEALTTKYTEIYRNEGGSLNILPPTIEPEATQHINAMQTLIMNLLDSNYAYAEQNHILFNIESYKSYGALSNLNMDEMIAGARVEVAPYKRHPADFVLWKPTTEDEPGWHGPEGWPLDIKGRPGWHLECSAMIRENLGPTIDIHGGGQDLRFPHHENEIAQSVCAHQAPLANVWMHNGFLQMEKDKMSKSLGNVVLVRDLLKDWQGEVIRWALLSAHYRQPLEWSASLLEQSKTQLDRFYRLIDGWQHVKSKLNADYIDTEFVAALNDDINTPEAMARLHILRDEVKSAGKHAKENAVMRLWASASLIGVLQQNIDSWFKNANTGSTFTDEDIHKLIEQRRVAKENKDYATADSIREKLAKDQIQIEDGPNGTSWRRI